MGGWLRDLLSNSGWVSLSKYLHISGLSHATPTESLLDLQGTFLPSGDLRIQWLYHLSMWPPLLPRQGKGQYGELMLDRMQK